jgi:hypothetical protein
MYGNVLRNSGLAWRVLGFPVDELLSVLQHISALISQVMIKHLSNVSNALTTLNNIGSFDAHAWEQVISDLQQPLLALFESIRLAGDALSMVQSNNVMTTQLSHNVAQLSCSFISASLQSLNTMIAPQPNTPKKVKSHDTKITFYFQRIILILESNKYEEEVLDMQLSRSTSSSDSSICSVLQRSDEPYRFAPLVHPMIEAGLVLAEFVGKDKEKPRNTALQQHLVRLCARYIIAVSDVMYPLLDGSILERIKVDSKLTKQFKLSCPEEELL